MQTKANKREIFTANARLKVTRVTFEKGDGPTVATQGDSAETKSGITLRGYPIVWGQLSDDRGGYRVRLSRGSAFAAPRVLALWCHDSRVVLGNTANGTLRILPDDDYGVPV